VKDRLGLVFGLAVFGLAWFALCLLFLRVTGGRFD
jgi:hypothetical protein